MFMKAISALCKRSEQVRGARQCANSYVHRRRSRKLSMVQVPLHPVRNATARANHAGERNGNNGIVIVTIACPVRFKRTAPPATHPMPDASQL